MIDSKNPPANAVSGWRIENLRNGSDTDVLEVDYSQIEARIMAHLSGDGALLKAFSEGTDIHRATAAEVFGVTPDAVTPDQRRRAKAIDLDLLYGMSAFGQANVNAPEAE